MSRTKTITSIAELQASGFGQPSPRHGLRLLYWFLSSCVEVDQQNQMISLYGPSTGDFGFRIFHNRDEGGKGSLLPDSCSQPYYELGNLSVLCAKSLPAYIREKYTDFQDKSNADRIIVSLESGTFRSIYVTRHETRMNFDPSHTFRIGLELVRSIKNMQREDFLRAVKRRRNIRPRCDMLLYTEQDHRSSPPSHQPHSQELHLHPAPPHTHHPHTSDSGTCISDWPFILLFLLTTAVSLCLIQSTHKDYLCT